MNNRRNENRTKIRQALLAATVGLVVAIGGAEAKAPASPGANGQGANTDKLAALLAEISSPDQSDRAAAADAFVAAAIGADVTDVVAATSSALTDSRPEQRYYALVGLGAAGVASSENGENLADAVFQIVAMLTDEDPAVREAAAATLAAIQPGPPTWAAAPLTDLLDDPEPRVASAAMRALERVSAMHEGMDTVQAAMDEDKAPRRSRAVRVIGAQGGNGDAWLTAWLLRGALRDPDKSVRWQAATALGSLEQAGIFALRDLRRIKRNGREDPAVRRAAAIAIATIRN